MSTRNTAKPTETQLTILRAVRADRYVFADCNGMSEHGGRHGSLTSCFRRGWIVRDPTKIFGYALTDAGRIAVSQ